MYEGVQAYQSIKASPPNIMVKNSAGSSVNIVSRQRLSHETWIHTKPLAGNSAVLSKLVILFPQSLVAENLVCFADLDM